MQIDIFQRDVRHFKPDCFLHHGVGSIDRGPHGHHCLHRAGQKTARGGKDALILLEAVEQQPTVSISPPNRRRHLPDKPPHLVIIGQHFNVAVGGDSHRGGSHNIGAGSWE